VLPGGSSYPAVTIAVDIASDASATVTNTATVNGGGETNTANNTSNDVTTVIVGDATPPTVAITSPLSGAVVIGSVNLAATASDNVGVAGVQFLLDGSNIGAEALGPGPAYAINWNTAAALNGTHTISARARDAAGNTTVATSVPVTVSNPDTTPPTVVITSPVTGVVATGTISLMASASDNQTMGGVQFLLDGGGLGAEIVGPGPTYTLIWNTSTATNGSHVLSARARDAANNTADSSTVSLIVSNGDATPPTVSLTSPAAGSTLTGTVNVTASGSDNVAMAGVQFLLDGANLGAEVTGSGPTYSLSWNTSTASNGSHTLSARARDVSNNTAVATNVSVTVSNTVSSGLLAAYSFNAGSGTTTVDSSGNGLTGTISGASWTSGGRYGNALSFNGTNSYVNLGNPTVLKGTGSMTWAAWVKATATPSDDGDIISKSNSSGWHLKTSPDTGPHTFAIAVSGSSGTAQRYSTTVRTLNTWYHVAGVYNATTRSLDIYVNGVLDNGVLRGTIPASQTVPNVNVNIGRRTTGLYFAGIIDEARIYNRALSAAEIQTVMNAPLP